MVLVTCGGVERRGGIKENICEDAGFDVRRSEEHPGNQTTDEEDGSTHFNLTLTEHQSGQNFIDEEQTEPRHQNETQQTKNHENTI